MGNAGISDRSRLPPNIQDKVCMCDFAKPHQSKWAEDRNGYWAHVACGFPNHHNVVWECDDCEKLFVPKKPLKYPDFLLEVVCDECSPVER